MPRVRDTFNKNVGKMTKRTKIELLNEKDPENLIQIEEKLNPIID